MILSSSMRIGALLIIATAHCAAYSRRAGKCPVPNSCIWGCDFRRKALECSESLLGPYSPELPDRHPPGDVIWTGDFSQNVISIIQNMAYFVGYDEVIRFRFLNYSHNVIRTIEDEAFLGQERDLHTLILDNNQLEVLPATPFRNLTGLRMLSISHNKLISLDFVCANTLPRLHTLDVSNNRLTEVSPSCFYGTRLGKTEDSSLTIRGNGLRYLDACTFQERQFLTLDYSNNSFICMCEMSWLNSYGSENESEALCYSSKSGDTVLMRNYTSENCETINMDNIECVDLVVNATYERTGSNESEVHINWQSKDFPHLAHFHATVYSFQDRAMSEVGRYKLHRRDSEFGYSIKISEEEGDDLVVCIEASSKEDGSSSPDGEPVDSLISLPIRKSRTHMQCQRVSVPQGPMPLVGSVRSGMPRAIFQTTSEKLILIVLLVISCLS